MEESGIVVEARPMAAVRLVTSPRAMALRVGLTSCGRCATWSGGRPGDYRLEHERQFPSDIRKRVHCTTYGAFCQQSNAMKDFLQSQGFCGIIFHARGGPWMH
jgi:hypothetical protein